MTESDQIDVRLPTLGKRLPREPLATLPTPVANIDVRHDRTRKPIAVKHDNLTSSRYGGNKVRKLEYALAPARRRGCKRIATFGAIGSNHALATALYAKQLGYDCTCFLSHQAKSPGIRTTLNAHLHNGTELVRYGGAYASRIATLREHLWRKRYWVVPAGGSSWLGSIGFVNAGLELAAQIRAGTIASPDRIYIATGTMGSTAGLAIGLALANINTRIEAIRVGMPQFCNEPGMQQLAKKMVAMMHRLDPSVPTDLARQLNIRMRHEFYAGGYAHTDPQTDAAIAFAAEHLQLRLETTYTGKAMAALLADLPSSGQDELLFWNTYNSAALDGEDLIAQHPQALPPQFARYLE